jgi:predicted nucleic acid-binding protein
MRVFVDATPLYNFGQIGELELFDALGGNLVIPEAVSGEITVEPAATNLDRFLDESDVTTQPPIEDWLDDARALLGAEATNSDVWIVAGLLAARDSETPAVLVSDDRRLRAVADGLGATVTGTFGIVVRVSMDDKYFSTNQAKRVIRRTDHHGIQMTGRLRERAIGEVDG